MKPFPCRFIIYAAFNIFNLSSSSILQLLASISKWSTDKTSSLHHSFTNVSIHFYLILMVAHICHPKQCLKNQCLEVSRSLRSWYLDNWNCQNIRSFFVELNIKDLIRVVQIKPIKISTRKHQQCIFFLRLEYCRFCSLSLFLFDGDDSNTKWWNQALNKKDLIMWSNKQI